MMFFGREVMAATGSNRKEVDMKACRQPQSSNRSGEEEEDVITKRRYKKVSKNFIMGHMLGHGDYPVIKMTTMS